MPQMMPINWIISFIMFIMIFIMFNVMNYYIFKPINKNSAINQKIYSKTTLNWKW